MQNVKIPLRIDPIKAASKGFNYKGILDKKFLTRLNSSSPKVMGDINVCLNFFYDEQKLPIMKGSANACFELCCQRCNEFFNFVCNIEFCYTPIYNISDKTEDYPERYELIELDEHSNIDLVQILEDEFIIGLPQIPMHEIKDCKVNSNHMTFGEIPEEDSKPNPFNVLEILKQDLKK